MWKKLPRKRFGTIREYEKIAARIFRDDNDTCVYNPTDNMVNRKLVYAFLTKNSSSETGRLGFFHRSFQQYFLASYIVSSIRNCPVYVETVDPSSVNVFAELIRTLGARRITGGDSFVFQLVNELVQMEYKDDFDGEKLDRDNIRNVLSWLDHTYYFAGILDRRDRLNHGDPDKIAERNDMIAVENALFNLLGLFSVAEAVYCSSVGEDVEYGSVKFSERELDGANENEPKSDYRIKYSKYPNICRMLRHGNYSLVNISGLDFSDCSLHNARLEEANMSGCHLEGTNLICADLQFANLEGAYIENCHFDIAML